MNLIDEQHVVLVEIRQNRRQVTRAFKHWPRGLSQIDAHLARDDVRQRGLAQAGRAEQQHVIERLGAIARCLDENTELFADLRLPDIFSKRGRTQCPLDCFLVRRDRADGDDAFGFGHFASDFSA